MASQWFVSRDGKSIGTFTSEVLAAKISSGEIKPDDFTWREGMTDWVSAEQLPKLFPEKFVRAPAFPKENSQQSSRAEAASKNSSSDADQLRKKWTVTEIVAAAILVAAFFLPQFLVKASIPIAEMEVTNLKFGWSTWFGILSFILGIIALGLAITRLVLNQRLFLQITNWVQVGLFGVASLATLIGVLLYSFGIGVSFYATDDLRTGWLTVAQLLSNHSEVNFWFIPLAGALLPIGAGVGLLAAILNAVRRN